MLASNISFPNMWVEFVRDGTYKKDPKRNIGHEKYQHKELI